jgi:hypothetical protein
MRVLAVILLGLWSFQAPANTEALIWGDSHGLADFEYEFDENAKAWKEIQAQLPPYPKSGNLVEFIVSSATSNRFYIDYPSITAGEDGVVRYTVLIRSPAGAETVSFEGLRCETGERKLYAFGRKDGQGGGEWSRNRYAKWEPIAARQASSHQRELFFHYLCNVSTAGDLKKIRHAVRSGGVGRGE